MDCRNHRNNLVGKVARQIVAPAESTFREYNIHHHCIQMIQCNWAQDVVPGVVPDEYKFRASSNSVARMHGRRL
uniref:Uncharacterized protein n=1 Tax=Caenorhabditis japonica TaxID=281687 RepID=A0A8R1EUW4_CAEJA